MLLAVLVGVMFTSCQEDKLENTIITDQTSSAIENTDNEEGIPVNATVLGKKLENPYSVENMKKALNKLRSTNTSKSISTQGIEIETTHLYVRFLPRSEEELSILKKDTLLDIFDYPLDYEIEEEGIYYHDPSLPDSVITWQYTVVDPDYDFPPLKYEILSELYILEEEDNEEEEPVLKSANVNYISWLALEDKALEITGNLEEKDNDQEAQLKGWFSRRKKWRPAGRITANGKPIVGCMVRARRWFTVRRGYTDSSGYFSCSGRFRRDVNYSIKWERYYWDIRSGTWRQAIYNGPKKQGDWNLNITGGKSLRYAFIHQAAYDYFYRNPFGTQKPFEKRWYRSTLKIGYYDKYGNSLGDNAKWRNWFTWPHIRIYKGTNKDRTTTEIYASTIHELAHSAHWQLIVKAKGSNRISDFINADDKLCESWAVGMQTLFTRRFVNSNYDIYNNKYTYKRDVDYSEIVLELTELANYTVRELEQCLIGANSLNKWQTNISNKYNRDEKTLDNIFSQY